MVEDFQVIVQHLCRLSKGLGCRFNLLYTHNLSSLLRSFMALTLVAVRNDRVMVLLWSKLVANRRSRTPRHRKRWNSRGMRAGAWCEDHAHAASFYRRLRRP